MAKSKKTVSLGEKMARIRKAAIPGEEYLAPVTRQELPAMPLLERIEAIKAILSHAFHSPKKRTDMMAFIAYDIENNKIRRLIAKYLLQKGCIRIQKSVYFVEADLSRYREMVADLSEVQQMYDNEDSLFFLPVGKDALAKLEVIGKDLHLELAMNPPNTLFI